MVKKCKDTVRSAQDEDEYDMVLACTEFENNLYCVLIEKSDEEDHCDKVYLETKFFTFGKIDKDL